MPEVKNPIITYTGISQKIVYDDADSTILDCSIANQIPHLHECGGNGRCSTCRIRILEGHSNLSPRTLKEQQMAEFRRWDPSIRLACQCYVKGDVDIQRLVWTSSEINKLQLETIPEGEAEERAIAILFCDIRNFTKMAIENNTFDIAHVLNRFYTIIGDPILFNNGVIYQYIGDEIVGLFGISGGTREKNCRDAARAALGMYYAIEHLNHMELVDFDLRIKTGIGINFGKAFIGHLGHPKHKQLAVVGDPINTASRIQAYNKEVDGRILISEAIFKSLPEGTFEIGREFTTQFAGHEHNSKLYELKGFQETDMQLELQRSLEYLFTNKDEFAEKFYTRVFEKAPGVRALFKKNMQDQGRLLTHMLGGIVYSLSRPEHLETGLAFLGKSHARYGVTKDHYPVVLSSMMETIQEQLGDECSPKLIEAWEKALLYITNEMKKYTN
ncbi:adenylate/guanylate cyclase domain-containing protein [Christiangramia sp. SM2212]|uniref:Adenylate/guanylate cyclase domain-containing protein n=1 Tax=Christiangramia sediminicola TaxID=3073267 RepID=A0ABU1EPF3_9FLAO|nr:adenylate/guanylate cyclase domain-containing protein [Christiangramia sp. SM2212]MDR5589907.1 adenylate/guanylate cyclase domain-containing protein [Christiangramia sp. SM2212]